MDNLSDEVLREAYLKARKLQLDPHFITLLEQEMHKRAISLHEVEIDN